MAFCPPEDVVKVTSMTGRALFYREETSLRHKVLAFEESVVPRRPPKDRVVPVGRVASKFLENYLHGVRAGLLGAREKPDFKVLFVSTRGLPLSKTALAEGLEQHRRAAGLTQPVTPHTLRHTCATHMVCNGANVRHVQEMLGHVSLDTTQIYLHLSIADLKEAHARSHPREQEEAYRPPPKGKVLPP